MTTVVDAILAVEAGELTVLDADAVVSTRPWRQVHLQARRVAAVLAGDGLRRGARVGLLADSSIELVVALAAVWLTGGAVTVLPLPSRRWHSGYADRIGAVVAEAALDLVVVADPMWTQWVPSTRTMSLPKLVRRAGGVKPAEAVRSRPGDLAILHYPSGSTKVPRGVPVTHAHLAANLTGIRQAMGHDLDHPGPVLSWLPLGHDPVSLALSMSCGCSHVLLSPIAFARRPALWLQAISQYRPKWTAGPNFAFGLLARALRASGPDVDLSSLRQLVCGGEPVDPATMAAFQAAAAPRGLDPAALAPAYGLAEHMLAVTHPARGRGLRCDEVDPQALASRRLAVPAGSGVRSLSLVRLGRPVPGVSLRVVDGRTGSGLAEREVGHIEVSGAPVVPHYQGQPPPEPGAWLRTGDLGYLAEDELVVCGRSEDLLFTAGRGVAPSDIEAAVAQMAEVRPGGTAVGPDLSGRRQLQARRLSGHR